MTFTIAQQTLATPLSIPCETVETVLDMRARGSSSVRVVTSGSVITVLHPTVSLSDAKFVLQMADEKEVLDFFLSLSPPERERLMAHHMNKRRLAVWRDLIRHIALYSPDLRTYRSLRCACKHFWKWLPPADSDIVTRTILEPHIDRFHNFLKVRTPNQVSKFQEKRLIRLDFVKQTGPPWLMYYRIKRSTGDIRANTTLVIGNVFDDNYDAFVNEKGCERAELREKLLKRKPKWKRSKVSE